MKQMKTNALFPGLIVGQNVVSASGHLLLCRGNRINSKAIQILKDHGIAEISVYLPLQDGFQVDDVVWLNGPSIEPVRLGAGFGKPLEEKVPAYH
jgi:hypothetical protein